MELNKAEIIITIINSKFKTQNQDDNIFLIVLLLNKYNCKDINLLDNLQINSFEKYNLYLEKAEQKILTNYNFRNTYFQVENSIKLII